ncbi:hypothetical protein V8Z80_05140 [Orrella sp. JC864]|uniref:hypothetical protein n=1 Tax=Orrella sp. JC864 TaxID=3120298 RepID=UPI0012BC71F5
MDPLTEFALFLFVWMLVILGVTMLGRRAAAWLRQRWSERAPALRPARAKPQPGMAQSRQGA